MWCAHPFSVVSGQIRCNTVRTVLLTRSIIFLRFVLHIIMCFKMSKEAIFVLSGTPLFLHKNVYFC